MNPSSIAPTPSDFHESADVHRPHPRTIGWFGTTAVALGGANLSMLILAALFVGQGAIPGQGSAAVLLLIVGVLLAWASAPGWTELVLMYPNRVGGIAATCAEAFRPYSPVLANLTGVCYWWGWAVSCGLSALLSASALHAWYLPWFPIPLLGTCLILFFTFINLCGVKWVMRLAMPIAVASAGLALASALIPIFSGTVEWQQSFTINLTVPFPGWFGGVTSAMAGLYLIGYLAPAFEQATCHVGETINPNKNVPRAVLASAALAGLYFIVLPVVWLGVLGPAELAKDLALVLGPTFAPLLGAAAKATAVWFVVLNMFPGMIAPLAGAARTLSQLAEDGLLPEFMARRSRTDAPWVTTLITAAVAIVCLLMGAPLWLIAAANFTYLIGIALPSVAVWLLRRNEPDLARPYRAPRGTIVLGLVAAGAWTLTTVLGFQQFGLPTVLAGLAFAYSGAALYSWRKMSDRRKMGLPAIARSLHLKLTGAMLLVLALDGAGYLIAVGHVPKHDTVLIAMLGDIFVVVAMLTIGVGLILPGMIAHAAVEVSAAADKLVKGTLADFTKAMRALAAGDLDAAKASFDLVPIAVHSRDEVGEMAANFNRLQEEIGQAALGLEGAREGLLQAREITETNARLRIDLAEMEALQRSEAALRESEERFRSVAESTGDGIIIADEEGVLLSWNKAACTMFGYAAEELIGGPMTEIMPERFREMHRAGMRRFLSTGVAKIMGKAVELMCLRKDGTEFPSEICLATWKTGAGTFFSGIIRDISERKQADAERDEMHRQLVDASRRAGMAEIATSVLHNVGNVLNSVNISAAHASDKIRQSCSADLTRVAALFQEHREDLPAFLTSAQGAQLPAFLTVLAGSLAGDQHVALAELQSLSAHIDHIKEIVAMQQSYARMAAVIEALSPVSLVESALQLNEAALGLHSVEVIREYAETPLLEVDKHKALQILVNLIRNAKQAMAEVRVEDRRLTLRISSEDNATVKIAVADAGVGIPGENLARLFEHGFTTRADGHGFGLHSAALAAKELSGALTVHSDGPGKGAVFTLLLPLHAHHSPPRKL